MKIIYRTVLIDILNPTSSLPTTSSLPNKSLITSSLPSGEIESSDYRFRRKRCISKIIIPSNIIKIWTRLEVLLGLKLSGHTDTLTEASKFNR